MYTAGNVNQNENRGAGFPAIFTDCPCRGKWDGNEIGRAQSPLLMDSKSLKEGG